MDEKIIVCVSHPLNAEFLIGRGMKLAHAFDCEGLVLNVHPAPYDEMNFTDRRTRDLFRELCRKYAVPLRESISGKRPVAEVIAEVVKEEAGTQIILGQSAQTRFATILHETLPNQLLKMHTGADLHIVEMKSPAGANPDLEPGQKAWVVADDEGTGRLHFQKPESSVGEGVFFKRAATEFNHGFFVSESTGSSKVFEVVDGEIKT